MVSWFGSVPMNTPSLLPCLPRDMRAKPSPEHDDDNADSSSAPNVGQAAAADVKQEPMEDSKGESETQFIATK